MRKKKKTGSKILSLAMTVMTIISISSMGIIYSSANNHGDTGFNFNFDPWSRQNIADVHTEPREKQDKTSSYMKCTKCDSSNYSAHVMSHCYVYGVCNGVRSRYYDNYEDKSHGYSYLFREGTVHYLKNWVKEDGLSRACIAAEYKGDSCPISASGLWSPDSI